MPIRIALTGDVMLGRLVDRYVLRAKPFHAEYVWGNTLTLLQKADLRLINLECVISQKGKPVPKTFNFRANPKAVDVLKAAYIEGVSLANNHSLDYGVEAFIECIKLLDENHILHAGAGRNLNDALKPAIFKVKDSTIALVSLTDNEPSWEAGENQPGVNYIRYDSNGLKEPYLARIKKQLESAKLSAEIIIASAHVGPNWGTPSPAMQTFAHQLIEFGADLYWGHSNHTTQGIEWYKNKPILYSTGDFIDDYAIDPIERNDLSFIFFVDIEGENIVDIQLLPTTIENLQANIAKGSEAEWVMEWMDERCESFGTQIKREEEKLIIRQRLR
ncbi:MAG TPA: CapA family protein [Bdellovibrionota bacterium]|nr:CapA family protein [Bdellovibrionota bacterium]